MPNKSWQGLQATRRGRAARREAARGVRRATRHLRLFGRSLERSPTLRIVTHFDTSSGSPGGPGSRVTGGRLPAWVRPLLWLPGARAEQQSTELPARSWGHSLGQATQPRAALPHSSKHRRLSWFPGLLQTASPSRTHRGQPQSLHLHHPGIKLKPFAPPGPTYPAKDVVAQSLRCRSSSRASNRKEGARGCAIGERMWSLLQLAEGAARGETAESSD